MMGEPKNNQKKRVLIITGFLFALIAVASAGFYWGLQDPGKQAQGTTITEHKKINILLLGINQRKNDIGRSNVTCVITIDPDKKAVSMLWVPRDSRVEIPGHEWNKIGHAYAYGGPELSKQTVSNLLGIPIDYYVAVNMVGFQKVIDALGGVDIQVDKRMYYYDPYDEGEVDNDGLIDIQPGLQHMDGSTALQYVRFRHDEMGDIGRIERQQKFAQALLADVVTPSIITKIPGVIKEASTVFTTDMPVGEMMSLSQVLTEAYKQGIKTDMVNGKPIYIDEISYWLPDIVTMRKQIAQIQGFTMDEQYLAAAQHLASVYEMSVPRNSTVAAVSQSPAVNEQTTVTHRAAVTKSKPKDTSGKTDNQNSTGTKPAVTTSTVSEAKNEASQQNTTNDTKVK